MIEEEGRVRALRDQNVISDEDAERLIEALRGDRVTEADRRETGGVDADPLDRFGGSWSEEIGEEARRRLAEALDVGVQEPTGDESFSVGEEPRLVVRGYNGRVHVTAGESRSIEVKTKLRNRRALEYTTQQEGDLVTVEVRPAEHSSGFLAGFFGQRRGADIEVKAPVATSVDLATSNGSVKLLGLQKGGELRTSNAAITVENARGDLKARTINGRITVDEYEGDADLETSNGRVSVENGTGQFVLTTSNGSITLEGRVLPKSRNRLTTSNGSIKVHLRGEADLKVSASTTNGRVRCDLPRFAASENTGRKLEGAVGTGDTELVAKTVNGSITIE